MFQSNIYISNFSSFLGSGETIDNFINLWDWVIFFSLDFTMNQSFPDIMADITSHEYPFKSDPMENEDYEAVINRFHESVEKRDDRFVIAADSVRTRFLQTMRSYDIGMTDKTSKMCAYSSPLGCVHDDWIDRNVIPLIEFALERRGRDLRGHVQHPSGIYDPTHPRKVEHFVYRLAMHTRTRHSVCAIHYQSDAMIVLAFQYVGLPVFFLRITKDIVEYYDPPSFDIEDGFVETHGSNQCTDAMRLSFQEWKRQGMPNRAILQ